MREVVGERSGPGAAVRGRARAGRIGQFLVSRGKLTQEQLRAALDLEGSDFRRLSEALLGRDLVSEEDLARAAAGAAGFEYVDLSGGSVDPEAARLLGEKTLKRYGALPLRVEDGYLLVAVGDPTDVLALDDLKSLADLPVRFAVATGESIRRLQDRAFAPYEEVEEVPAEDEDAPTASAKSPADDAVSVSREDEGAPVVRLVNSIIRRALSEGASDIHVEPRAEKVVVRYRIDGVLTRGTSVPLGLRNNLISRLKIMGDLDISERRLPQDGRFTIGAGREGDLPVDVRVASLPSVRGEKIVLRLLTHEMARLNLGELGLSPEVLQAYRDVFTRPYGAVVVTGPTGSGKSTTLYTTLSELNEDERNIVTIEDPVEYRMEGITQMQVHPVAGLTFASGLRHILRGDPDVVMVGEIRDRETAELFVEAALTGHMVLATLHTNDAAGALPRLTNMGIDPFLSTSAIGCVVAQRLARRLCAACKRPVRVDEAALRGAGFPFELYEALSAGPPAFCRPVGCEECRGKGYAGRIGIYELMPMGDEVETLALSRSSADEIGRAAARAGMVRMRADGLLKAAHGITPLEEVLRTTV